MLIYVTSECYQTACCVDVTRSLFAISYHYKAHRNPIGFLPQVWRPLQATLHLCGIFTCPGIDAQVQGTTVFSLIRQMCHFLLLALMIFDGNTYLPPPGSLDSYSLAAPATMLLLNTNRGSNMVHEMKFTSHVCN
jgi:hypothetical protein